MNSVVEEMNDILMHYGMPRRSGRYPWGSGKDPYQHAIDFLGRVEELRKQGWKETPENIMDEFGLTTSQYRTEKALCRNERRSYRVATAKSLREDGLNDSEIGRRMGVNESTVRSWFNEKAADNMNKAKETAAFLKERMAEVADKGGMIDVGAGAALELNISKEKLDQALYLLEREGYGVYSGRMDQVTNPGQKTTQKVLCPPHIKPAPGKQVPKEIYELDKIHSIKDYISRDDGKTYEKKFNYPSSMDSKRLQIRYNEEGGLERDGTIELRRGVSDLSLGNSRYSQVRILVDGTHYLKGMAIYSDDMPDGVDVIFNTNKKKGTPALGPKDNTVLKPIKADPDNPFGSAIKDADQGGQYWYDADTGERCSATDPTVKNKKLGLINKRADEGDWTDWKDALPSQFLAKQTEHMAKKQLNLAKADKLAEYDDICALENPTIKKHLLQKFADGCDSAAVHLKAAALPGQKYHVIVPINSLKDDEIYAPRYENGSKLALIRYPHGGTFEIPILTVNNKNKQGIDVLGTEAGDAVGITSKVAERLSGADFDGDTVMCIPTHDRYGKVKIKSRKEGLKGLEGFDPKDAYSADSYTIDPDTKETHYFRNGKEYRIMKNTGTEMGIISNLITDMTLGGATDNELAAAVRHSMVVIDAEKHKLDYKQSEIDNNIAALHVKYQGKKQGGAATILSRAKGQASVDKRQGTPKVNMKGKEWYDPSKPEGALIFKEADDLYYPVKNYDKKTGTMVLRTTNGKKITYNVADKEASDLYTPVKRINEETGEVSYTNKDGTISYKMDKRRQQSTKMAETDDAYSLLSEARHPMEVLYADYANSMKALANTARKEMMTTGKIAYSKAANELYSNEVSSLLAKLNKAELNKTREREALRRANVEVKAKQELDPDMKKSDLKKTRQQAMTKHRSEVGATNRRDRNIDITDREWEAIQAGAISESKLKRILDNTDISKLRERATPRTSTTLSSAKVSRIRAMSASNYSLTEIADALGVSTSTVSKYLKGVN